METSTHFQSILVVIISFFMLAICGQLDAQSTYSQTNAGTYYWTAPCGVTAVDIELWGAGGAGGGVVANAFPSAGGGGAGGAYIKTNNYAVIPGKTYKIVVGSGGLGVAGSNGNDGEASYFLDAYTVMAIGGKGGSVGKVKYQSGSGAEQVSTGNIGYSGSFNYYGGGGAKGSLGSSAGGGGGSAGTASNGNSATSTAGASAVSGGGAGANAGSNAAALGGGGGGAQTSVATSALSGGNGFDGKVVISYTVGSVFPDDVKFLSAASDNGQMQIGFTVPYCYDEVLIVAKASSTIASSPSGNGSSYTANSVLGVGTAFDGGSVVFKGTSSPFTLSGLTNGTTYYVKAFVRSGTNWSSGYEISATPSDLYYWNGGNTSASPAAGGAGSWTVSNGWRYPNASGSRLTWADDATANIAFSGTAGIVTLASNRTFDNAIFKTNNYSIVSNGTTSRSLTGDIVVGDGLNLILNNASTTTNRTLSLIGNINGANNASISLYANQVSGSYSKLALSTPNATISVPITVSTGSNSASYGTVIISGESTSTQLTEQATIVNNSSYKTSLGSTTGNSLTVNSVISGSADLVFATTTSGGDGTINLNNRNTYSGDTYLSNSSAGIVKLGVNNALPITTNFYFNTAAAGSLDLNGFDQQLNSISGSTGGKITNNGASLSKLEIRGSGNYSYGRTIVDGTGAIALTLSGNGTTTLTATTNSYSGGLTIKGHALYVNANSGVGSGTMNLVSGTLSSSSTTSRTFANSFSISGDFSLGDATNNGALTFSGNGALSGGNHILTTNSQVTFSNAISDGNTAGGIIKEGAGILVLSSANTFSGDFIMTNGEVRMGASGTGSAGSPTNGPLGKGNITLTGGTLTSNSTAARTLYNTVFVSASTTIGDATNTGALTFAGNVTLQASNIDLNCPSNSTFSGVVADGGNAYTWSKSGAGTLTLTGANTFTGLLKVNDGVLRLNRTGGTTIPNTNNVEMNGGTLKISTNQTLNNVTLNSGVLMVDAGVTLTINGTFTGNGTITNNGTITLVGPSTFPGTGATISAMSNLKINRASGVTLNKDLAISGTLTLTSGSFNVGNNTLTLDGPYLAGTVNNLKTNSGSSLVLNCTGVTTVSLPNFTAINNLTINSASRIYTMKASPTISGTLTLSAGTLALGGFNLTYPTNGIVRTSGTIDASATNSTLIFGNATLATLPAGLFSANVYNINVTGAGGITLGQSTTISNRLTLSNGVINASSSNVLEIGTSAASPGFVTWTAGYVSGPMKRWFSTAANASTESGVFPVGSDGLNKYAQINFTGTTDGGYIVTEYKTGTPANEYLFPITFSESGTSYKLNSADGEGYWDITPYNASGTSYAALDTNPYTLKLRVNNPTSVQNGGILANPPRLRMIRAKGSVSGHGNWQLAGTFVSVTAITTGSDYVITSNNVMGFSWFNAAGDEENPLPVELVRFSADCSKEGALVQWETASEKQSDYFTVLTSENGLDWQELSSIKGAGNSNSTLLYQFTDTTFIRDAQRYYKLNQYDWDGELKSFDPILLTCAKQQSTVKTYPNPSQQIGFSMSFESEENHTWEVRCDNVKGETIFTKTIQTEAGSYNFMINEKLPAGVYLMRLIDENGSVHVLKHIVD